MNLMDLSLVCGFWSSIGEALFGTETKKAGREATANAQNKLSAVGDSAASEASYAGQQAQSYGTQAAAYDKAAATSMGSSASEYMQNAANAASTQAESAGTTAATQGTKAALQAARSSGLSKGQAALTSGQTAADTYTNTYQNQLTSGENEYMSATSQLASQGNSMASRQATQQGLQNNATNTQLGAATGQANVGQAQISNANQTASNTWGTIGTVAGAAAGLLSDEDAKKDIEEVPTDTGSKFNIDSLKNILNNSKGNVSTSVSSGSDGANQFANGANAGINVGLTMSNQDILRKIPDAIGSIIGKLSDENAKTNVQEVPADNTDAVKKAMNAGKLAASTGSSAGKGFQAGIEAGTELKDALNKNKKTDTDTVSDEHAKININDLKNKISNPVDVMEIAKKVRPVKFQYKKEIVQQGKAPDGEHIGVIAQDLEKTPLAPVVHEGDDGLKRIDTSELSPAILNLVIQLARKVDKLEGDK